jgi:putative chitinase
VTLDQFYIIMPKARPNAGFFVPVLNRAMDEFGIATRLNQAAFLATVAHESAQLTMLEENLNYSAEALAKIWPRLFPPAIAREYARLPTRIANRAYANREGNGNEASGDGWRNRGAGAIGLTFENNHAACGRYFRVDRNQVGAWLRTPEGACRSAGWFWKKNGVGAFADASDFDGVCDVVNRGKKTEKVGDAIGWVDRLAHYKLTLEALQ